MPALVALAGLNPFLARVDAANATVEIEDVAKESVPCVSPIVAPTA